MLGGAGGGGGGMGSAGGEKERRGHGARAGGGEPWREADRSKMGYFLCVVGFLLSRFIQSGKGEEGTNVSRGEIRLPRSLV